MHHVLIEVVISVIAKAAFFCSPSDCASVRWTILHIHAMISCSVALHWSKSVCGRDSMMQFSFRFVSVTPHKPCSPRTWYTAHTFIKH